jgi:hypothetical protein
MGLNAQKHMYTRVRTADMSAVERAHTYAHRYMRVYTYINMLDLRFSRR